LVVKADGAQNSVDITPPNSSYCRYPEWAPDQTKIVVSCDGQIYAAMADGSSAMRVGEGDYPRWSPLGNKIAFVSNRDTDLGKPLDFEGSITSDAIYIMDADGSNIQRITMRNDESILWFVWFPRK
jgi:Tol biopolymer transport system component